MIPPETTSEAIKTASTTLEQVALLDKDFPDIGDSFAGHSSGDYTVSKDGPVQPILTKARFSLNIDAVKQMQRRKLSSPAGFFSAINRAYFAVDSQLFLWNYNNRQDFTHYEDSYEIVSAAIVQPKPDVFNNNITHVLILATTESVKVIPMAYRSDNSLTDSLDFYDAGIQTFAGGIRFTNILGTSAGRVFMTGSDGQTWELAYKKEDGWFTRACYKRILSGDYTRLLPGGSNDPCVGIAVSADGKVLYQLTQKSSIKVSYLGDDGQGFTTVAADSGISEKARLMCPNNPLANSFTITSIHSTPSSESKRYQLVAITSTGCRLYFSHFKHGTPRNPSDTPDGIVLIHVRTPPPRHTTSNPASQQTNTASPTSPPSIFSCFYNNGVYMSMESNSNVETLTSCCPDIGYLARTGRGSGLHEMYNNLPIEGNLLAITEVSTKSPFQINELATSTPLNAPRLFLVFTTQGLAVLLKQRPLDMLQNLVIASGCNIRRQPTTFKGFSDYFGVTQASSLCFGMVGLGDSSIVNGNDLLFNASPNVDMEKSAADLLNEYCHGNVSDYDRGLALYVYRVIGSIWTRSIMKQASGAQPHYQTTTDRKQLLNIVQVLRNLLSFLARENDAPTDSHRKELCQLICTMAEAVSFIIYLFDAGLNDLLKKFNPVVHSKLKSLTYEKLLTTKDGHTIARNFAQALVDHQHGTFGNADELVDNLKQHFGFFSTGIVVAQL